ncbi:hypothetical protein ACHAWF_011247, partial [Thalassiosira exigua]
GAFLPLSARFAGGGVSDRPDRSRPRCAAGRGPRAGITVYETTVPLAGTCGGGDGIAGETTEPPAGVPSDLRRAIARKNGAKRGGVSTIEGWSGAKRGGRGSAESASAFWFVAMEELLQEGEAGPPHAHALISSQRSFHRGARRCVLY